MVVRSIKHISCLIFMYGSERKMPSTAISCSLFGCSCGSSLSPPSTITIKLTCIYFTLDSPSLLPHSGAKKEKKRNRRKRELNSFTIRRHAVKEVFTGFLFFLLLPLLDCRAPLSLSLPLSSPSLLSLIPPFSFHRRWPPPFFGALLRLTSLLLLFLLNAFSRYLLW